jgi:enamine deaminase RidA (YjgF/YER057c/UK114 family)
MAERRVINPWSWQDQFGFVQANEVSGGERVLYCAGQTSVDTEGHPLHPGDMGAQLGQALDNLETVLGQAGFELADVVRMEYYVTDIDAYFPGVGAIAGRLQEAGCRPASTLLEVPRLALPELMVEIQATAVK